ncbi:unnamed protein product [Dimorphilus gyrociliatus]|uniref:Uncharacterized protein n=1 Tax=Dimorphilus gyrociliatus TaxID=2664684 RepID=A0A7I8VRY7_9ANNE|nr:unnamed protein product [Dimorphilus gyrociliatus]
MEIDEVYKRIQKYSSGDLTKALENASDINQKHKRNGDTLLHITCRLGRKDLVQILIESFHANPEIANNDGKRPLHEASQNDHLDCVEYLLERKVCVDSLKRADWTSLMLAAVKSSLNLIKVLIDYGASTNVRNKDGWTPIHIAVRSGRIEIVSYFLTIDSTLWETRSNNGRSILHTACIHGHCEMVKYLLRKTAISVHLKDSCGLNPLMDAVKGGSVDIIDLLVTNGANINDTDNLGKSCIHIAAQANQADVIKHLIKHHNVDINAQTTVGLSTALHIACKEHLKNIVKTLLELGANPALEDSRNRKAEEIARIVDAADCLSLLTN